MDLYFSPLSCSLATRITLYESGAAANFIQVDPKTKRTVVDQDDYLKIHTLGLVPVLQVEGEHLTENAAILQFVARRYPAARLVPEDELGRARLQQWLCFVGTELHKGLFSALLDETAPAAAKQYARERYLSRLDYLEQHLTGRTYLLETFSVADAYLFAVLNWAAVTAVDLRTFPAIHAYHTGLRERPSIAKAFAEELRLFNAAHPR